MSRRYAQGMPEPSARRDGTVPMADVLGAVGACSKRPATRSGRPQPCQRPGDDTSVSEEGRSGRHAGRILLLSKTAQPTKPPLHERKKRPLWRGISAGVAAVSVVVTQRVFATMWGESEGTRHPRARLTGELPGTRR